MNKPMHNKKIEYVSRKKKKLNMKKNSVSAHNDECWRRVGEDGGKNEKIVQK